KYAKQNEGIMVSSKVEKLFFSLYDLHDEAPYLKYFVGKMTYMEEQELKQWLSNTDGYYLFDSLGVGLTKTLLIKRMAFQHENEVRLIFNAPTKRPAVTSRENWGEELYVYNTNPKNIFDEYLIDPRLADGEVEDIRKTLLSSGVPKASVSQSSLYKSPKLRMKMLHR
ncbi:MAG: hypothetical protein IID61_18695, partial [SAR324 cluster bacterium]|nr:hypothetical protein [SAR324 cluster bacterium]